MGEPCCSRHLCRCEPQAGQGTCIEEPVHGINRPDGQKKSRRGAPLSGYAHAGAGKEQPRHRHSRGIQREQMPKVQRHERGGAETPENPEIRAFPWWREETRRCGPLRKRGQADGVPWLHLPYLRTVRAEVPGSEPVSVRDTKATAKAGGKGEQSQKLRHVHGEHWVRWKRLLPAAPALVERA